MCDNCETCQKLFRTSQEKRSQTENNQLKPCTCKDKDCPFCLAVEIYQRSQK